MYLIFIFLGLTLLHFIYESIILPSVRLHLRYKLFCLRDELRLLKHDMQDEISDEIYRTVEVTINNAISILPYIDFVRLAMARNSGPDIKKKAEKKAHLVNSCKVDEVKRIFSRSLHIMFCAFLANIGAWFVYVVPIALVVACFQKIFSLVKEIVSLPESDLNKIIPAHSTA